VNRSDPGLQAERTSLAWSRTAVAMAVNALLVLRTALQSGQGALMALGALLLILAAGLFAASAWRRLALQRMQVHAPPALLMLATTFAVLLGSGAGIWAIVKQG
jgi:uncharacterized membrane protein YidH (DUF202 family)